MVTQDREAVHHVADMMFGAATRKISASGTYLANKCKHVRLNLA
jgi:hypothetical protein